MSASPQKSNGSPASAEAISKFILDARASGRPAREIRDEAEALNRQSGFPLDGDELRELVSCGRPLVTPGQREAHRQITQANGQPTGGKNGPVASGNSKPNEPTPSHRKPTAQARQPAAREIPLYEPFPLEALPRPLSEYVRQAALALGCDPSFVALPVLAVVASAIGNTRTIRLKPGWEEQSIVWSAVIADSGTLKSPAYRKAVGYVVRAQKRCLGEFRKASMRYQESLQAYDAASRKAKGGDRPDPGERPDAPILHRVICSDTTIEKLAEILEDNPRGTLVARDELAGWLASFTRYKGKAGGTDLPNWLELWQAGTVIVDRKTGDRKSLFVPRAAASITGTIQPGVLTHALSPEFLEAGLAARLLLAMPPKLQKRWSESVIAPDAEQAYHNVLDGLLALGFGRDGDGENVPRVLSLSPSARTAWIKFYNSWALEQAAAEGELAAAFSKLEAYAARFALLHHVVGHVARRQDDVVPIEAESIAAGVCLSRWFAREARRIYATLTETTQDRDTRRLVEWIRSHGGRTTAKQLQNSNSRKYPNAVAATLALDALVGAKYGCWAERPVNARGGRPTNDFVLFPTTDETSSTEDSESTSATRTAPDETPVVSHDAGKNSGYSEVSSVSSEVGTQDVQRDATRAPGVTDEGVSAGSLGDSSDGSVDRPDVSTRRKPFRGTL
jgi:hypothetical protein